MLIKNDCKQKKNGYGMTESSPLITVNLPEDSLEKRTKTIGKGLEQTEIKIVDNKGRIVKVNETGELLVRGYNTMLGYWNDKTKTDETYTQDRFLKTGYLLFIQRISKQNLITYFILLQFIVI